MVRTIPVKSKKRKTQFGLLLWTALLAGCSTGPVGKSGAGRAWLDFVGITNLAGFAAGDGAGGVTLTSSAIPSGVPWDELVVSWNVELPAGAGLKVEARAVYPDRPTAYYTMGWWAEDVSRQRRESVNGQQDEDGDVRTDTLVLVRAARRAQVRLTLLPGEAGAMPRIKFLGLSFAGEPPGDRIESGPSATARGHWLEVPEKSQLAYEGGRDWCSPTSISMVLAYWAAQLGRAELINDVPAVAEAIYDRNWPGTGNWPFNTAYAGRFAGMRAFVTRFAGVSEIETWLAAGVPVIASVSSGMLGGEMAAGGGHLVVCVGFDERGNIVLNDPWPLPGNGQAVRRTVPLRDFMRAWRGSRQTVYLIHPVQRPVPAIGARQP